VLVFWREENRRTRRKTLGAGTRTNNKLNPHTAPGQGIEPGPHWWEASAVTTVLSLLSIKIQLETIDFRTRLRGLNYGVCGVYSPETCCDVYYFRLTFKISKLGYWYVKFVASIDHIRILGIGLELACNGGSCGGISLKTAPCHLHLKRLPA